MLPVITVDIKPVTINKLLKRMRECFFHLQCAINQRRDFTGIESARQTVATFDVIIVSMTLIDYFTRLHQHAGKYGEIFIADHRRNRVACVQFPMNELPDEMCLKIFVLQEPFYCLML